LYSLSALLAVSSLWAAAPTVGEELELAQKQIHDLNEEQALVTLQQAADHSDNPPEVKARIRLLSGLAYSGLALERPALSNFRAALQIDSNLPLPAGVSPRVEAWWMRARNDVLVAANLKAAAIAAQKPPFLTRSRKQALVLSALAAVAVGVGVGFGAASTSLSDQSQVAPDYARSLQLHTSATQRATVANVLFIGGGTLGLGAGGWFAFGGPPSAPPTPAPSP
jgi:hypothetical protein